MKPLTVVGLIIASPFLAIGAVTGAIGITLLVTADSIRRVSCTHNWKYVGFWRDRAEGEYERKCQNCDKHEWTDEIKETELMCKLANLEVK